MSYANKKQEIDPIEISRYVGYMHSYGIKTVVEMNKYLTQNKMWNNFKHIKTMNTFESGFKAVGISISAYREIMRLLGNNDQSHARLEKQEYIR